MSLYHDGAMCPDCQERTGVPDIEEGADPTVVPSGVALWRMRCVSCGVEWRAESTYEVARAWFAHGAYEQHLAEKETERPGGGGVGSGTCGRSRAKSSEGQGRVQSLIVQDLDPGVRRLVVLLNAWGFPTCDSGDGMSKPPDRRVMDVPHVFVEAPPAHLASWADRLARNLGAMGIELEAQGPDDHGKYIAASYDPVAGTAIIALIGVADCDLPEDVR